MQIFKLFIIVSIIVLFAFFIGMESEDYGSGNFVQSFWITLLFGLFYISIITIYYIGAKTHFVKNGEADTYANPLDIWLLSIPMCVLMIVSYLLLQWHVAEVFFCTMMSLSGMLFANNLGRGTGRWHIKKSMPFFLGCILTITYGIVIGGVL